MKSQSEPDEFICFRSRAMAFLVPLGIAFALGVPIVIGIFYLNDVGVLHIDNNLQPLTAKQYVAVVIGSPLLYIMFSVVFLSQPGVGNYRINCESIEQTLFRQGVRKLRWQDVQKVKWGRDFASLQGKDSSISILWALISREDQLQAKPFLESVLSPHFDLSISKMDRRSFHRKLVGLYLSGAAVIYGLFIGFPFLENPWDLKIEMLWVTIFSGVTLIMVIRAFKNKKISEQLDPPWRMRRKEENPS